MFAYPPLRRCVLIGLLAVWIAEDTDAALPEADNAAILASEGSSDGWIVALGDSYISGEGLHVYEPESDDADNQCHRAPGAGNPGGVANPPLAYPQLIVDPLVPPVGAPTLEQLAIDEPLIHAFDFVERVEPCE